MAHFKALSAGVYPDGPKNTKGTLDEDYIYPI